MLSLRELNRAADVVRASLTGATLHRAVQVDNCRLVLVLRGDRASRFLQLSCRPEFARIGEVREAPAVPATPLSFGQYLRAHVTRASLAAVHVETDDRLLSLTFSTRDSRWSLLLSILGNRSNLYLLDGADRLVHAARPLEETRRELTIGGQWLKPDGVARHEGADRWADVPDDRYLESIECTYASLEQSREFLTLARRIEQVLRKEESFLERKASNLLEDLMEARRAGEYRRQGNLLKSVLHLIRPGDEVVRAVDYESGRTVEIPIDPKLSPAENLETFFRRYQKVSRGIELIEDQAKETREGLASIAACKDDLRRLEAAVEPDLAGLQALAARPMVRRLLHRYFPGRKQAPAVQRPAAPKPGPREIPARLLPKRYKGEHGYEVWVGRNDDGNDFLTTRLARGNDLFFHLEGYPGSHVVLRTEGRLDPPPEALLDACELAVHFSKLKNATRADVHVAAVKDVKKPRGAKPGLVYVTRGKTMHLRRSPKRLESILASRLDGSD